MRVEVVRTRKWTRQEYERLIGASFLHEDEPVELVDGELVVREPQYTPHATAIQLAENALREAFGSGWSVRVQLPMALTDDSEPEPDVCVVRGTPRTHRQHHPSTAALVVEVAQSGLAFDRGRKGRLYARAAIPEYWILNLINRVLEVYRRPVRLSPRRQIPRYTTVQRLRPDSVVSPLAAPSARIRVRDLLP